MEDRIISLLVNEDAPLEKRLAAALVLGEVGTDNVRVILALAAVLDSDSPKLQQRALAALAALGAKRALPKIVPLLVSPHEEVRVAARQAVASVGGEVVGTLRGRLAAATHEERRAIEAVLSEVGGTETLTTIVRGLASATGEAATQAAQSVKRRVKDADPRAKVGYLREIEDFLATEAKARAPSSVVAAGITLLGTLEDPRTVPTLLSYVTSKTADVRVKKEAILAFRHALRDDRASPKVVDALASAAESEDRSLAQTALQTLGSVALAPESIRKLGRLLASPDPERVAYVIELLGRAPGGEAAKLLVEVLTRFDRRYAEAAARALFQNEAAAPALAKALLETSDHERAFTLRDALRPLASKIPQNVRKDLLTHVTGRLLAGERGWEAALEIVRDTDPDAVAEALRQVAQKLVRARRVDAAQIVLDLLTTGDRATPDDEYLAASLALQMSPLDAGPGARASDPALVALQKLAARGYDVPRALRRDRTLDLEHLYYVGVHLFETGHPGGRELLDEVRTRGGRAKVARLARGKLGLS
ncbi:MAG: HEAT repeat domain-containing protein [Myxococcales bacterium]|nr:HEAT repeat domain-containing protein [Myxococcales bacterium]MBL9107928.1 HEAT repeat domain-containing protein [Myxococcales bacterium]